MENCFLKQLTKRPLHPAVCFGTLKTVNWGLIVTYWTFSPNPIERSQPVPFKPIKKAHPPTHPNPITQEHNPVCLSSLSLAALSRWLLCRPRLLRKSGPLGQNYSVMNCLSHVFSYYSAILSKTSRFIAKSSLYGCSTSSWKSNFENASVKTHNLEFMLTRFHVQNYSSRRGRGAKSQSQKLEFKPVMEEEKDAFFVVRKGDVVGVYKTFSDCQAQVGSSFEETTRLMLRQTMGKCSEICDPPVSVYKGYSLPKDTEEYLVSHGLRNAIYTIRAADLKEDLFGKLMPCPCQEPTSSKGEILSKDLPRESLQEVMGSEILGAVESRPITTDPLKEHIKLDHHVEAQALSSDCRSCVVEFDGASKGNPGPAGAAAVLRSDSGRVICRVREGLGLATNNVAEYQAMILGLKYALKKGYTSIRIQGDSKLVCMQLQGLWKVRNKNMSILCKEAKKLKDEFLSVEINHVLRELNSEADAQANLAVSLAVGEVQEVCE